MLTAPFVEQVAADLQLLGDFGDRFAKGEQTEGLLFEFRAVMLIGFLAHW